MHQYLHLKVHNCICYDNGLLFSYILENMHCKIAFSPKSAFDLLWYIARGKGAAIESIRHNEKSKLLTVICVSEIRLHLVGHTNYLYWELLIFLSKAFLCAGSIFRKRRFCSLIFFWRSENEDFLGKKKINEVKSEIAYPCFQYVLPSNLQDLQLYFHFSW